MGTLLVVDGSDVCRAPIVTFLLRRAFAASGALGRVEVVSRGLAAAPGSTMCDNASSRLGFSGPAIAFYGAHRAARLTVADVAAADLVLTAERAQRSAVVRMLPGTQAAVFTWREALALSTVLLERHRSGTATVPEDLPSVARALHAVRGTLPVVEPEIRTGGFHWRRSAGADPLTIVSGHDGRMEHHRVTLMAADVATSLGEQITTVTSATVPELRELDRRHARHRNPGARSTA